MVSKPFVHVQRRDYGNKHGEIKPSVIVLHSTECGDRAGNSDIEGVLRYLERTADGLGVHFVVDKEGRVGQGGYQTDLLYHCKGANSFSVGIEMIGFARFSFKTWITRRRQRRKVAKLLAYLSDRHGIPLVHSTNHGVAMHRDFPESGHTDPGKYYPFKATLRLARQFKAAG